MKRENNAALIELARVWELDGDLMRCRVCHRALIASKDGEPLHHTAECPNKSDGHPWLSLREALED